eukprot:scaffold37932_cov68-Phaeocystis_antarctica.AAC.8
MSKGSDAGELKPGSSASGGTTSEAAVDRGDEAAGGCGVRMVVVVGRACVVIWIAQQGGGGRQTAREVQSFSLGYQRALRLFKHIEKTSLHAVSLT